MILVIDIGNTDVVFGLYSETGWRTPLRRPTAEKSEEAYQLFLANQLHEAGISPGDIRQVVLSSVVPAVTPALIHLSENMFQQEPLIVGPAVYPHLDVTVSNPEEMGTDLVANAVAAYDRFRQCCIVVDFGTALTFTAVGQGGEIAGVAIAPGLKTSMYALFHQTAQLPEVPLELPASALGQDTTHALQAGILIGYVGLVEKLLTTMEQELVKPCKVIATGGLSGVLTPLQARFDQVDRLLTLDGLRLIGEQVKRRQP